jgi:hypothetical protein
VRKILILVFVLLSVFSDAQKQMDYLLLYPNQFNQNLKDWFDSYKGLSLNPFRYQSTATDTIGRIDIDTLDKETRFLYKGFIRYSPAKKHAIDLLSGHCFLDRKGKAIVDEGCDHGGYIYIWNLQNNTKYSISDMSSCAFYEEGFWLSDTIFVLASIDLTGDCSNDKYIMPRLSIFNLQTKKRSDYFAGGKAYKKLRNYMDWLHKKAHVAP